ncbi:uncharacterized protein [Clytia hemisphaerica]|uniref:Cnidarian restricted protein n=1 Tax=Clytia hemisphaerica TaxID=252671 RepID=A0A7M5X283_9CNID
MGMQKLLVFVIILFTFLNNQTSAAPVNHQQPSTASTQTTEGFLVINIPEYMRKITTTPFPYNTPTTQETTVVSILLILGAVAALVMISQFTSLFKTVKNALF